MAWQKSGFRIIGAVPLLCHNGQTADPLNSFSVALKEISSKRKKTDVDQIEMAHLQFIASLYLKDGKPCIPGEVVEATLLNAGKTLKKGKDVSRAITCEDSFPLQYEGPTDPEKMWEASLKKPSNTYLTFTVTVKIKNNRVPRTRAKFDKWAIDAVVVYDDRVFNKKEIVELMQIAGRDIGFGDWRPKYGRFTVKEIA
ncbi:MAG: hypothetical protein V2B18_00780 [Pseudomonadota bacterium]